MRVIESDGWRNVLWILEFPNATLEACNGFAHDLGTGLALSIVVLACIWLLCSCTLLAGGFNAITFLRWKLTVRGERNGNEFGERHTIFRFLKKEGRGGEGDHKRSVSVTGTERPTCSADMLFPSGEWFGKPCRQEVCWPLMKEYIRIEGRRKGNLRGQRDGGQYGGRDNRSENEKKAMQT